VGHISSHFSDCHENWYVTFLVNLLEKFKFHFSLARITSTLHEYICTFMVISRSIHMYIYDNISLNTYVHLW
jgi:hypothetical protein